MRRRPLPTLARALIALLAAMQMAVPALVTIADARLASASAGAAQAHVEEHTGRSCRAVHPDDCALCQLLSHTSWSRVLPATVPVSRIVRRGFSDGRGSSLSVVADALQRSRAPPLS